MDNFADKESTEETIEKDSVTGESMAELMDLYEESFKRFAEGEVVTGRVISIDKDHVLIDIGYKSEGQVRIEEFLDESSNFLNFKKKYESFVKVAKELESNSIFLEPSYQALGFSNFIDILIQLFDRYQMDPEISPKVFKYWVRKILLEMKNHYS